ncbi:MAG: hypothetical protein K2L05_01925 [Muribaculaceae bacterium]|nr:hypothetical protein [Muribaculaceae bacterium]
MKKIFLYIILAGLCAACSHKQEFSVEADIPRVGTQEITVVYTTPDGNRAVLTIPAIGGKFEFAGECADSADVEIFSANKQLLAAFGVRMNEQLKLVEEGDSLRFDGVPDRLIIRQFTAKADTTRRKFPELDLIVGYDTVAHFEPGGVWFFSSNRAERTSSFIDSIKAYDVQRVRDVYVSAELRQWMNNCRADSFKWQQGLMPDAPLRLDSILTVMPCLIEVDSTGMVLRVQRLE